MNNTQHPIHTTQEDLQYASRKAFHTWSSPNFHQLHLIETQRACRTASRPSREVTLNPHHNVSCLLKNIQFTVMRHIENAETDGQCIKINRTRSFTRESLYWTLLHEIMHNTFLFRGTDISEEKEHQIMVRINEKLRWPCG